MSANFKELVDVRAPMTGAKAGKLYNPATTVKEEFIVSQSVSPSDLRRLLECLRSEDCVHSWRNFGPDGTLDELLQWENNHRPTKLFFFYLKHGDEQQLCAASAVAYRLTRDFPHPGFCVLGRCYIMPQFRSRGIYRQILRYRLEHCRTQFANTLNGIHIGSVNERISRVITNHRLPDWSNFIHLGEEDLKVGGEIRTVGAYMLLLPDYIRRIRKSLAGDNAPPCVVELQNALSNIESGDIRNLGMLVKEKFEEAGARGWFDRRESLEIEQLLLFCRSIPLVGFK
ncbi:MAG TPA: GNAT family N-acetyltransferase [Pyrinomonadaceae bacterium]|jgi:GNAT superfamily N-acetyltransferase